MKKKVNEVKESSENKEITENEIEINELALTKKDKMIYISQLILLILSLIYSFMFFIVGAKIYNKKINIVGCLTGVLSFTKIFSVAWMKYFCIFAMSITFVIFAIFLIKNSVFIIEMFLMLKKNKINYNKVIRTNKTILLVERKNLLLILLYLILSEIIKNYVLSKLYVFLFVFAIIFFIYNIFIDYMVSSECIKKDFINWILKNFCLCCFFIILTTWLLKRQIIYELFNGVVILFGKYSGFNGVEGFLNSCWCFLGKNITEIVIFIFYIKSFLSFSKQEDNELQKYVFRLLITSIVFFLMYVTFEILIFSGESALEFNDIFNSNTRNNYIPILLLSIGAFILLKNVKTKEE